MSLSDIIQLGLLLTAVATVVLSMRSQNDLIRNNLFLDFSRRYQEIMLAMPKNEEEAEKEILLYIDLCSEEYRLHRSGNVDKKTWELWKDGMKYCFSHHPSFIRIWENHSEEYRSDSFYDFLNELIKNAGIADEKKNKRKFSFTIRSRRRNNVER